jgi:DNA-directed RNA polymerase subunit omega
MSTSAPLSEKLPKNNAHCSIPDDPEQSINRFIVVAAKRARQLQGGARPYPGMLVSRSTSG